MSIKLSKSEIRNFLEGLDVVRDRLRIELAAEGERAYDTGDYQQVVNLQDKLIEYLESISY